MHFDRYLEDSCDLELEKRLNKLGKKKDRKTEDQVVAIINAFIYRQELRKKALTSSQKQLETVLNQLITYCVDRNFSHDDKIVEIFTRLVALLTSSNPEEI